MLQQGCEFHCMETSVGTSVADEHRIVSFLHAVFVPVVKYRSWPSMYTRIIRPSAFPVRYWYRRLVVVTVIIEEAYFEKIFLAVYVIHGKQHMLGLVLRDPVFLQFFPSGDHFLSEHCIGFGRCDSVLELVYRLSDGSVAPLSPP